MQSTEYPVCKNGLHVMDDSNVYVCPEGFRRCRACRSNASKRRFQRIDYPCSYSGCERKAMYAGFCNAHYLRWYRNGDPGAGRLPEGLPIAERIAQKSKPAEGGCLVWTDHISTHGYGILNVDGKMAYAHRLNYELHHGEIPEGLEVDHMCHNRACLNVDHLRAVTKSQNQANRRGPAKGNKCGVLNVSERNGKFQGSFTRSGKRFYVGTFATPEEARAAVDLALTELEGGETE